MDHGKPKPPLARSQGSALARAVLNRLGWKVLFDGLPQRQGVLVVYPHTSNWDFVVLILAKWSVGLELNFWAKDSLFRLPLFGAWLRWLGGMPVNRRSPHGTVGSMVKRFEAARANDASLWLAVTPEGTRKWTQGWRSGFYAVALGAQVPVGICCVNFPEKTVQFQQFCRLTGDAQADMQQIAAALQGASGKHPAQASPIRLIER